MLNTISIKPEIAPKDGKFDFMISDLEAMFPDGLVDRNVEPVYKEVTFFFQVFVLFLSIIDLILLPMIFFFRCHNGKRL